MKVVTERNVFPNSHGEDTWKAPFELRTKSWSEIAIDGWHSRAILRTFGKTCKIALIDGGVLGIRRFHESFTNVMNHLIAFFWRQMGHSSHQTVAARKRHEHRQRFRSEFHFLRSEGTGGRKCWSVAIGTMTIDAKALVNRLTSFQVLFVEFLKNARMIQVQPIFLDRQLIG